MAEDARADLNAALTSTNTNDKIGHLTAVKEAIIHRKNEFSEAELLDIISELCSPALQLDAAQPVRHFVLLFVEELARSQGTNLVMLQKPMEALALMLEDENQPEQIARWALTTAAKVWKCVMFVLATQTKNAELSRNIKGLLWRVKAASLYALQMRKDRAARLNAVKFIEVMALSLYNEGQNAGSKKRSKEISLQGPAAPQFESLKDARTVSHPSLPKPAELNREGVALLQALIDAMKDDSQPTAVRVACCNSLVLIARQRPDTRDTVIDSLVELVSSSKQGEIALMQTIKTNTIMLLKSAVPDEKSLENNDMLPRIIQILRTLKADEHINRHLDPLKKRKQAMDNEQEDIKRRLKDYPPQKNKFPTEGLRSLPIETLAKLLVENAGNVPREPPPGHKSRSSRDAQVLVGPTGLPPRLERVMALIRAVETGRGILNLPKPLQELQAIDLPSNECLRMREKAFTRVCDASFDVLRLDVMSRGFGWAEQSHETCGMVAARLACDTEDDFADAQNEAELRAGFVERLLAALSNDVFKSAQGQVILEDEVPALTALHIEFAAERTRKRYSNGDLKSVSSRYEHFLNDCVSRLLMDPWKNAKRLSKILAEAPSVPESTLHFVLEQCEDVRVYQQYLVLIRELVLARPTLRQTLVDVLLVFATRPETGMVKGRRPDSVRVIANKIYRTLASRWGEYIKSIALDALNSLSLSLEEVPESIELARVRTAELITLADARNPMSTDPKVAYGGLSVDEEKAEIAARLELYIALCASDVTLLPGLFEAYAKLKSGLSQPSSGEMATGDNELKIKQRITRMMDLFHSDTDKLWEKVADVQTPISRAFGLLNNFADGARDLVLRACSVFAKRDPDGSVLPLCSLRAAESDSPMVERDARFLVPIVGSLGKDEAFAALRMIAIGAEPSKAKEEIKLAMDNIVNGALGRTLEPSELLVHLATMDCAGNLEASKNATDAFLEREAFVTDKVMRKAFEALVEEDRLPVVLLRIVMIAYRKLPILKMDALRVLQRLAERDVWNNDKLWLGFIKLAESLFPESLELILRLPGDAFNGFKAEVEKSKKNFRDLLKNAYNANPQLKDSLILSAQTKQYLEIS